MLRNKENYSTAVINVRKAKDRLLLPTPPPVFASIKLSQLQQPDLPKTTAAATNRICQLGETNNPSREPIRHCARPCTGGNNLGYAMAKPQAFLHANWRVTERNEVALTGISFHIGCAQLLSMPYGLIQSISSAHKVTQHPYS